MAVTNEQITSFLAANPDLDDAAIAALMNQNKVSADQMAQATGLGRDVVQSRYNAAISPLNMQRTPSTSGTGVTDIGADNLTAEAKPLYSGLTAQSKPEEIAAAYRQAIQGAGGDTQENQNRAFDYLTKTALVPQSAITDAYGSYRATEAANAENALAFAYKYGHENDDFSGLASLLNKTPNSKELISKFNLTPEQINEIEFGTGFDLDQSGAFGAGQAKSNWDYGKYLSDLKTGESDTGKLKSLLDPLRTQNPLLAKNAQSIFDELIAQQNAGTSKMWSAGKFGTLQGAALDTALRLAETGVSSLADIGVRKVERLMPGGEGSDYLAVEDEYFNKATGEKLQDWDRLSQGNTSGGKINYQLGFTDDGVAVPYTTPKQSDWVQFREGTLKPAASLFGSFIPGAAPYIAAANAANAASKGDWGTALVSALTAVPGFNSVLKFSPETMATLSTAKTAGQVINAIDKGNPVALANALMQTGAGKDLMLQDMGGGISLGDVVNTAKIAQLANTGNYAEALATAGELTSSPNLRVAASAVNFGEAIRSGDPFRIMSAVSQLDGAVKSSDKTTKTGDLGNRIYDDTITQAGADAFIRAKEAGASDDDAMAAADAATGVVINKIPDAGPSNVVTTTYGQGGVDTNFGDLEGAIATNAINDATRVQRLNQISSQPKFADAYSQARSLLGPNQTFTWNGKEYSTATARERPDLSAPKVQPETDESAAETARLLRQNTALVTGNAPNQSAAETARLKSFEKTGFLEGVYKDLNDKFKLQGEAANEYLKNNPNSPITASVSSAFEAAGELQKNLGGAALALDNKPLADAIISGGSKLQTLGQSLGDAPQDTKNWNDTVDLISKAKGTEKLAVLAGRVMDGTSGLARQVGLELRQELPALFLGGGLLKPTLIASGLIDTADTGGAAVVDAYDNVIKKGGTHQEALIAGRKAGAAAAATEAAIQLTLGRLADFGAGKLDNLISKGTANVTGKGAVEGSQEAGASAAVDLALGNAIDINKALTQGVVGAAVGKGTAAATSPVDAATTSTVSDAASTSATTGASNLGPVGEVAPGADVVTSKNLDAIGGVTPGVDAAGSPISVAEAQSMVSDLGLNVSDDMAVSLATKIQDANNSGNDVSVTSDANTVTINDATANIETTVDANTGTTTVFDANTNITSQTKVDGNTQTTVVSDANANTNTQTVVDAKTNTTTSTTVDSNNKTTTQTTIKGDTQTTVLTDLNTNTQTTVKVNINTGELLDQKETAVPDSWTPPVVKPPEVPTPTTPPTTTTPTTPTQPKTTSPSSGASQGAGLLASAALGLPVGMELDFGDLRSKVTGGFIDPLARVKEAQAELERDAMMQNVDPRLMQILQQRQNPQQQSQQFDSDIGALAKLLSGESDSPRGDSSDYYSYGSEDSIDDILGGKAAGYKQGGAVSSQRGADGIVNMQTGGATPFAKSRFFDPLDPFAAGRSLNAMYNDPYSTETGSNLMPLERYGGRYADELSTKEGRGRFARDVGYVDQNTGQTGFYRPDDLSPLMGLTNLDDPVVKKNYANLFDIGNSYFIPDFLEVDPYQYNFHSPMAEGRSKEQQEADFNRMYSGRNMAMNNAFTQGKFLEGVADPEQVMRELLNAKERQPQSNDDFLKTFGGIVPNYDDQLRQSAGLLAAFDLGRGDITYDQAQGINMGTQFQNTLDNTNTAIAREEQAIKNLQNKLDNLVADPANMQTYNELKAGYMGQIESQQANLDFQRKSQARQQAALAPYLESLRDLSTNNSHLSSSDAINRLRLIKAMDPTGQEVKMADGGMVLPLLAKSGGALRHYKGREDFTDGKHVAGKGDGQSDDIPAWLADGEYVLDAELVAALGNGSTKAGTELLDEFRLQVRKHKRGGSLNTIPPKSKSPLSYLKMAQKSLDKK